MVIIKLINREYKTCYVQLRNIIVFRVVLRINNELNSTNDNDNYQESGRNQAVDYCICKSFFIFNYA